MKMNWKDFGLATIQGVAVVIGTPLVAGLVSGVELLQYEVIPDVITVGAVLSAGVVAMAANWVIDSYLK